MIMDINNTDSLPLPELDEDERYQVHSRTEILAILRIIKEKKRLVTFNFNQGRDFILTCLLEVNPEFEELVFDYGRDEEENKALLATDKITIVTEDEHIKIQFRAQRAESTAFQGKPAFRIRLPRMLIRLQRREYFRIPAPVADPLTSKLALSTTTNEKIDVRIADISRGGVALIIEGQIPDIEVGKIYRGLKIDLPEVGIISADVEIRNISQYTARNDSLMKRIGCKFINLPNALANMVQRYITKLEVSRRKRS